MNSSTLLDCGAVHLRGSCAFICGEVLRCRRALKERFPGTPQTDAGEGSCKDARKNASRKNLRANDVDEDDAAAERRVLASLEYVLLECRQGIFVSFIQGMPRLVAVMACEDYESPFALKTDLRQYRAQKALERPDIQLEPPWVEPQRFWASHGILCNVPHKDGFSAAMVPEFLNLLRAAAAHHPHAWLEPSFDFFLNRRDCPLFPSDPTQHPYAFVGPSCRLRRPPPERPLPALSLYVGRAWNDYAMVEALPWPQATAVAWRNKKKQALFRGSSTGRGTTPSTNVRLALCAYSERDPRVDAGVTSWSSRDKCTGNDEITFQPRLWDVKPAIPIAQWSAYKFLLYAEGYSAALRLGPMLSTGSCIVWVYLEGHETSANEMWYYADLRVCEFTGAASWGDSLAAQNAAVIRCSVARLKDVLDFLCAHDAVAEALGRRAREVFDELQATRVQRTRDVLRAASGGRF